MSENPVTPIRIVDEEQQEVPQETLTPEQRRIVSLLSESLKRLEKNTGPSFKRCKIHLGTSLSGQNTVWVKGRSETLAASIGYLEEIEPFMDFVVGHAAARLKEPTDVMKLLDYFERYLDLAQDTKQRLDAQCERESTPSADGTYDRKAYQSMTDRLLAAGIYQQWLAFHDKVEKIASILEAHGISNAEGDMDGEQLARWIQQDPERMRAMSAEISAVMGLEEIDHLEPYLRANVVLSAVRAVRETPPVQEDAPSHGEVLSSLDSPLITLLKFRRALEHANIFHADAIGAQHAGFDAAECYFTHITDRHPADPFTNKINTLLEEGDKLGVLAIVKKDLPSHAARLKWLRAQRGSGEQQR